VTVAAAAGSVRARRPRPEPEERTAEHRRTDGTVIDILGLDPGIFGLAPNVPLLHQVVTAQLAAARAGTQSTKTRAEVSGGGTKPFRQKGTGRARQGSTRSPQWAGGGVALGPKPRSYRQRTPKKMIRLALHCALSDRATDGRVVVVDEWSFAVPKTKDAVAALAALGLEGRVLVVLGPDDGIPDRSFANLPSVQTLQQTELNAYDVIRSDWVVFTDATLPGASRVVAEAPPPPPAVEEAETPPKRTPRRGLARATAATSPAPSEAAEAGVPESADSGPEETDDEATAGADAVTAKDTVAGAEDETDGAEDEGSDG